MLTPVLRPLGGRVHRDEPTESKAGSSAAIEAVWATQRPAPGDTPLDGTFRTSLAIVCPYRTCASPGLCPLSHLVRGPFTRPAALFLNPTRPLAPFLAGECPLYARAIVILIWPQMATAASICLSSSCSIHEAAHTDVHHNTQRQKHKQDGRPAITH